MAAAAVGGILLASVTLYAVLGGADFGGGLWDLLAGGDRRGRAPRALIEESITPVWEANHVWLIFDLVIFWTAFPHAFAAVMTTAALPLWLAVAGIVLRGAGFAFRKELSRLPQQRAAGATFAFSSLLTPFFMGTVVGAIASGQIPANAGHASLSAWTSATSLLTGLLFVSTCSYIAAVYLVGEAAHRGNRSLQHYFTRRAQAAAIITGALSLATLAELHISNAALFSRLTGRALALVIIAGLCGLAVLGLLTASRPRGIRIPAALGVAAVIWGWGVAQYPELLPGTSMTLTGAGTPHATLVAIIWLSAAGALILGPSYALLFALQGRQLLQAGDEETDFPARPGSRGGRDRRTSRLRRVPGWMLRQWRRPTSAQQPEGRHPRSGARELARCVVWATPPGSESAPVRTEYGGPALSASGSVRRPVPCSPEELHYGANRSVAADDEWHTAGRIRMPANTDVSSAIARSLLRCRAV